MDSRRTREKLPEYVAFMKSLPFYKKVKQEDRCFLLGACVHRGDPPDVEKKRPSDLGYLYGGPEEGDTGICLCCGPCPDFCYPGIPENARRDLAQPGRAAHRRGLRGSVPGPGRTAWLPVPGDGRRILCVSPGNGIAGTCVAEAAVFAVFACRICREEGAYEDTLQRD